MRQLSLEELLAMYRRYKVINEQAQRTGRQLARAKLRQSVDPELVDSYDTLHSELQALSDDMRFSGPSLWIRYKFEAYVDEAQPIRTMHDFRLHCGKPGYICTARYAFLEAELERLGEPSLSDKAAYPDERDLMHVLDSGVFDVLGDTFLRAWRRHEYFRDDTGAVAKWAQLL